MLYHRLCKIHATNCPAWAGVFSVLQPHLSVWNCLADYLHDLALELDSFKRQLDICLHIIRHNEPSALEILWGDYAPYKFTVYLVLLPYLLPYGAVGPWARFSTHTVTPLSQKLFQIETGKLSSLKIWDPASVIIVWKNSPGIQKLWPYGSL